MSLGQEEGRREAGLRLLLFSLSSDHCLSELVSVVCCTYVLLVRCSLQQEVIAHSKNFTKYFVIAPHKNAAFKNSFIVLLHSINTVANILN